MLQYEYDSATGRLERTYTADNVNDAANITDYEYDLHGRLFRVTATKLHGQLVTGRATVYEYDAVGNLASVTQPGAIVTAYGYDGLNRLERVTVTNGGGNKLFEQEFTLAADGQRETWG